MDLEKQKEWGRQSSGRRDRVCPVGHKYFGGPALRCPECKKNPPQAAEGVIELAGFKVRVILEPIT